MDFVLFCSRCSGHFGCIRTGSRPAGRVAGHSPNRSSNEPDSPERQPWPNHAQQHGRKKRLQRMRKVHMMGHCNNGWLGPRANDMAWLVFFLSFSLVALYYSCPALPWALSGWSPEPHASHDDEATLAPHIQPSGPVHMGPPPRPCHFLNLHAARNV